MHFTLARHPDVPSHKACCNTDTTAGNAETWNQRKQVVLVSCVETLHVLVLQYVNIDFWMCIYVGIISFAIAEQPRDNP